MFNSGRSSTHRLFDSQRARAYLWWHEASAAFFEKVLRYTVGWTWVRHLPGWPLHKPAAAPIWPSLKDWHTPEQIRTIPGTFLDPAEQERVARERPFYDFFTLFPEYFQFFIRYSWQWMLPSMRTMRLWQDEVAAGRAPAREIAVEERLDPQALSDAIRAQARALGINAIGFAPYDPKYVFFETPMNGGPLSEGSVIVCLTEQDFELTQEIPSAKTERSVMRTYLEMVETARQLADFLHAHGVEAQVQGPAGRLAAIPYAVQAGLGQLGLNGQLLTPVSGSRARICLITTDATLVHDQPFDFGVHAICDECQLCVKRCPSGAIPNKRASHRGVIKAKIKPERCLPVMTQAHGCAICMKVCPVQRFGLKAVTEHFLDTGEILGKGTDELEGFHWLDGRHYGPGEKPRITKEFMAPLGIVLEPNRLDPPACDPSLETAEVFA